MKKRNFLLLFGAASLLMGCFGREDDKPVVTDSEEFFTVSVVTMEGTVNFDATTDGVTDYITARLRKGVDGDRIYIAGKNFDRFLDVDLEVGPFTGSGTFNTGDSEENPNYARYGQGRSDRFWWVSDDHTQQHVTTGVIVINDTGEFLTGTVSFEGYRPLSHVQVEGRFKVRKDY